MPVLRHPQGIDGLDNISHYQERLTFTHPLLIDHLIKTTFILLGDHPEHCFVLHCGLYQQKVLLKFEILCLLLIKDCFVEIKSFCNSNLLSFSIGDEPCVIFTALGVGGRVRLDHLIRLLFDGFIGFNVELIHCSKLNLIETCNHSYRCHHLSYKTTIVYFD